MDFLKRHYEKIILSLLLIVFIMLLIYLIKIIKSTNEITKEDLKIPTPRADYRPVDFLKDQYVLDKLFNKGSEWQRSVPRVKGDKVYTDLLVPFKCARCPHCRKIVPKFFFLNPPHKCPIHGCGKPLPKPVKVESKEKAFVFKPNDWDNDGIPNAVEEKIGLDPKFPEDANDDLDNDGFSNLFEYNNKTNINNAKSHPPMYKRLKLVDLRRTVLDAELMKVIASGKDKKNWDVQVNVNNGKKTKFITLGDPITLDRRGYSIVDITHNVKEIKRGNSILKKDNSTVTLKSDDDRFTIVMQVGKPVYSPLPKAIVVDLSNGREYQLDSGDKFSLGNKKTRISKYKVLEIDTKKRQIKIRGGYRRKKTAIINEKPQMSLVVKGGKKETDMDSEDSGSRKTKKQKKDSFALPELNI
ncbi:hypothetical protein P0136_02490 [Lentisphaerota bacterium ZTH]|nr:hypothetical protein JYG24_06370 [Lentisphaerota bacterium]WET06870.1 hypothetical protein P0136_02490 [Lentisphaerota bacterium ZTH]